MHFYIISVEDAFYIRNNVIWSNYLGKFNYPISVIFFDYCRDPNLLQVTFMKYKSNINLLSLSVNYTPKINIVDLKLEPVSLSTRILAIQHLPFRGSKVFCDNFFLLL